MSDTSSTKRSRPGGRSARVVAAVHAATFELLEEDGFENLQLSAVADRAKVNRTTVYRRWPSRVDLVAELLTTFTELHVPDPQTGSLERDLVVLLSEIADALRSRAIRSVLRSGTEAAENDPQIRRAQDAFWERRFRLSGVIVERAIASGELPDGSDSRALLELAAGPIYVRALFTADPIDDDYIARLVDRVLRAFEIRSAEPVAEK
jgi:AcrR family transcriptional regulator